MFPYLVDREGIEPSKDCLQSDPALQRTAHVFGRYYRNRTYDLLCVKETLYL